MPFDKKAEIIPNLSLGGCRLRLPLSLIQEHVLGLGTYRSGKYEMLAPFEACYRIDEYSISISVDTRNGKIYKIGAYNGYLGTLYSHIYPGMLMSEAMSLDKRIYYDELEGVAFFKDCPGISLDVGDDPPLKIVSTLPILAIIVFAPEAFTPEGNKGNW